MISLPLFPLNLVLLPYELLPLHIFEPRYKKMVRDHIEKDKPFGIILNEDNVVCTKGCRVKVQKVGITCLLKFLLKFFSIVLVILMIGFFFIEIVKVYWEVIGKATFGGDREVWCN